MYYSIVSLKIFSFSGILNTCSDCLLELCSLVSFHHIMPMDYIHTIYLKSASGVTFFIKDIKSVILTQIKVYLILKEVPMFSLAVYVQATSKEQQWAWWTLRWAQGPLVCPVCLQPVWVFQTGNQDPMKLYLTHLGCRITHISKVISNFYVCWLLINNLILVN